MKKHYSTPKLTTHGSVEAITQFFGNDKTKNDFLFFPGTNTQVTDANGNVVIGRGSSDSDMHPRA